MSSHQTKSRTANITLVTILIAATVFVLPSACRTGGRRAMAESVSNVKQIKLCLDSFAMDNDGVYPAEKTAALYELPVPKSSNDHFRQLFASGNTNSEKIFWSRHSHVCSKTKPDDVTTINGRFDSSQTLPPGDNHWAYFTGLKNTDSPARPIMVESYIPGTTTFDKKFNDNKAIVLRVDGSARPERLSPSGDILDGDAKNLLTTDSQVWKDATPDLRQPDPAP